jgi:hypothetical protein
MTGKMTDVVTITVQQTRIPFVLEHTSPLNGHVLMYINASGLVDFLFYKGYPEKIAVRIVSAELKNLIDALFTKLGCKYKTTSGKLEVFFTIPESELVAVERAWHELSQESERQTA